MFYDSRIFAFETQPKHGLRRAKSSGSKQVKNLHWVVFSMRLKRELVFPLDIGASSHANATLVFRSDEACVDQRVLSAGRFT